MKSTKKLLLKAEVLAHLVNKHVVTLASIGNPDFGQSPNSSLYGAEKDTIQSFSTFREARKLCSDYIERNELGGGSWFGGDIISPDGKLIAHVSYNGRIWEGEAKDWTSKTIEITDLDKVL